MTVTITQLAVRPHPVIERLTELWESSVRTTHDFLTEGDIQGLKPLVSQGLLAIPVLCTAENSHGNILGFMGVEESKIEMLFIAPEARGGGIGRRLIDHAIGTLNATQVDVNEQNHQAVGFYRHMGFTVFKRSPVDGQGNPFPLLHMEFKKA